MNNEDLIADIQSRFQRGHRGSDIKKALLDEGWSEKEIDSAIAHLHHLALKQMPIISSVIHSWENLESKVLHLPRRTLLVALGGVALVLILLEVGLFIFFDPLNTKANKRDAQREIIFTQTHTALEKYFEEKQMYPESLAELVPKYLSLAPKDSGTGEVYSYRLLENEAYELCVAYEARPVDCVTSEGQEDASIEETIETSSLPVSEATDSAEPSMELGEQ